MTDDRPLPDESESDREPATDGGHPQDTGERPPAVTGQFYAGAAADLREQISECFRNEYGPGPLGEADTGVSGPVTALVSPHAGYPFSGPIAAHGFAALAGSDAPETVVICGPNHRGVGATAAVAPHERWRTPLGSVPVDAGLASTLVEASDLATFDDRTHVGEHSIEVQLPFLQHCLDGTSIVPVCLTRPGPPGAEELGRDIAAAVRRTGRDAVVLSSTDLTHYEDHDTAVAADEPVVDAITALNTDAIAEAVEENHSMCGPWATIAGLTAARELGASDCEQVQYATSGQTHGRTDRVVGYCSAVFC